jgi:multiple sugar transport system substrate-binding protein
MNRKFTAAVGIALAASLSLASCSSSTEPNENESSAPNTSTDAPGSDEKVKLTLSGWSLDTTPEFQLLADGFTARNQNVEIEVIQYDATDYNTLLTTDLAAGKGPDIITQKEVKFVSTFQEGGQLLDVSDLTLPEGIGGVDSYTIDGKLYAAPYRQDVWVVFYNKDLYEAAGVDIPTGNWTWDDYTKTLEDLKAKLPADVYPQYVHGWQSTVQGLSNAQAGADILAGTYGHLAEDYNRQLAYQDAGLQVDFNTRNSNQLTYQGEFGTQKAANLLMGTWYTATLISQQASGEAQDFEWGMAPVPQRTASNTPVTFGDPTGFAINANIDDAKLEAAKAFLEYAAGTDAASALAGIGITPALKDATVDDAYFSADGAPTDELSQSAWSTYEAFAENPTSSRTATIQGILNDLHSAVLSGNTEVAAAITEAEGRVANEAP